jgi:hypothetical protein
MPLKTLPTEPMKPDTDSAAYKAGLAKFAALKIGDDFQGAAPEAEAAGYTAHGERFDFIAGYLRHLGSVVCSRRHRNDRRIMKLERKK